jgi:hypothetical protein
MPHPRRTYPVLHYPAHVVEIEATLAIKEEADDVVLDFGVPVEKLKMTPEMALAMSEQVKDHANAILQRKAQSLPES